MYGVDLALLVAKNKRKWPGLTKVARLRQGTDLRLPLPEDTLESIQYDGKRARTHASPHACHCGALALALVVLSAQNSRA